MATSAVPAPRPLVAQSTDLDRLIWVASIAFSVYGVKLDVRVNNAELLDRLVNCLPPGAMRIDAARAVVDLQISLSQEQSATGGPAQYRLYGETALLLETGDLDQLFEQVESTLNFAVAVKAPDHLFVHAGVVGWRGKAIIFPGVSRSGKTELVAALTRAGATYYSDEFAVIDEQGRVHPYTKPLSIRRGEWLPRDRCTAESLRGRSGTEPLPVGQVVITGYQPGARWQPRRLSGGEALLALLQHTVLVRVRPELALNRLRRMLDGARALDGPRGEAHDLVPSLLTSEAW